VRILLQRFDAETGDEKEKSNEHDATTSFLTQLATWHKQELDEKLASRVQVSQRAVGKIIQVKHAKILFMETPLMIITRLVIVTGI
jgi:E3 ubiquitin-protein ligase BRE1